MRQANDALVYQRNFSHALAKMVGAFALLDIGAAALDHKQIFASEERKFAVHPEGLFCHRGVFQHDRHALALLCREAKKREGENPDGKQGKDQDQIAPKARGFLFCHVNLLHGEAAAAKEASLLEAMHGAYLNAETAGGALLVVDRGKVVLHGDRAGGAVLFAFSAADASALADLAHVCALVFVGAFYHNARGVRHKVDDAVGAGLCAEAASDAL